MTLKEFIFNTTSNIISTGVVAVVFYWFIQKNDNKEMLIMQKEIEFAYSIIFEFVKDYNNSFDYWDEYVLSARRDIEKLDLFINKLWDARRKLLAIEIISFKIQDEYDKTISSVDKLIHVVTNEINTIQELKQFSSDFSEINKIILNDLSNLKKSINRKNYYNN